jgi:hypothetical protein
MKKCINLKPHEAAALARGETITIWRPCKPQPDAHMVRNDVLYRHPKKLGAHIGDLERHPSPFPLNVPLLGKETWTGESDPATSRPIWDEDGNTYKVLYAADGEEVWCDDGDGFTEYNRDGSPKSPWRSSTQMPPWAVRTLVILSDVRVRKPCDVTEEEAKAMGFRETSTGKCFLSPIHSFCEDWSLAYGDTETAWNSYWWSYTATPSKNLS